MDLNEEIAPEIDSPTKIQKESEKQVHPITLCQQTAFLLLGMLTWASYPYCFDIPQTVQTQLQQQPYSLSPSSFNYLYVCISIPNIVLSFVGAIITTKIGAVRAICIYVTLLFLGQGIITWSVYSMVDGWYGFLLFGRTIVGISGYSLVGANLTLIPKFTQGNKIPLFVGLGSMLPWTTQSLTSLVSPIVYANTKRVYLPFALGLVSISLSIVATVLLVIMNRKLGKKARRRQDTAAPQISLRSFRKLGRVMLAIFIIITFAVSIEGSIIINANDMLHERVGFSNTQAGPIAMMTLLVNCITSPLWAFLKEKISDKRVLFPVVGLILLVDIVILYFLPEEVSPMSYFMAYTGFILLGVWDSGAVTLIIGSIPQVLPQKLHTLGFSVYTAALALGMGVSPIITGAIIDRSSSLKQGYKNAYYLYFCQFVVAFSGILYLWLSRSQQAQMIDTSSDKKQSMIQ